MSVSVMATRPLKSNECRALVHHAVKSRFDLVAGYRPPALRGLKFNLLLPDGNTEQISGISGLREYEYTQSNANNPTG